MELSLRIGITENSIRGHLNNHPEKITCCATICKYKSGWAVALDLTHGENFYEFTLSSQRACVRRFATLEAAHKACSFADSVSVVGQ